METTEILFICVFALGGKLETKIVSIEQLRENPPYWEDGTKPENPVSIAKVHAFYVLDNDEKRMTCGNFVHPIPLIADPHSHDLWNECVDMCEQSQHQQYLDMLENINGGENDENQENYRIPDRPSQVDRNAL